MIINNYVNQYGFMENTSSRIHLIMFFDEITTYVDKSGCIDLIYLDWMHFSLVTQEYSD